ncbi:hypothetical protein DFH06DRAFT_1331008 [Mycena polygramma]|nr:hypothetical protein DFH06DRAFT_1331008 [Mycena polygramma]
MSGLRTGWCISLLPLGCAVALACGSMYELTPFQTGHVVKSCVIGYLLALMPDLPLNHSAQP